MGPTARLAAPHPRHGGDEEGGRHEEGRHEGWSDEGCDEEGEEGGQRDEEGSHEEGHEEGQGGPGGMRAKHRGRPLWIFCRARPGFFRGWGRAEPRGPALLYIVWLVSVACASFAKGARVQAVVV